MAGAMLSRWLETGLDPEKVTVVRPSGRPVANVRVLTAPPAEPPPAMLMLGMKPQMLAGAAPGWQAASEGALVVSILAGTTIETLKALFPKARRVVRAMPNLPVALGKGVVAMHGVRDPQVEALMTPLGLVEWIDDEAHFDAVTALAGSGPAFLYRFIDALAKGGTALGIGADQAARLALATVEGAAALAVRSDATPAELAERVASKGGSTRAGLDVLDSQLDVLVAATLAAAERRNAGLATSRG
ncbi:MAG: pyrroline-5-carboxylate reductase [Sphingomonadaceae bacterium]|nr:pyrroline-5-carboxylate reductase [Sphingomonadaceae bacterium]